MRRSWGRRIAAITGSVGKTTTKEILAALLGANLRVLKSEGNLNNEYGLPLGLLRLEPEHEAAVMELGMSIQASCGGWPKLPSLRLASSRVLRPFIWSFSLRWTKSRWPSVS